MFRLTVTGVLKARILVVVVGLAALVVGSACRKERAVPKPAVSAEYPTGRCDVTMTGAAQHTFTTPGGSANVATVYWMTDDELRKYFAWQAREETKLQLAEEDVAFFVDQAMAKNPRFTPLLIRCPSVAATVTLVPGMGSRYEEVPFRPALYKIAPAFRVEDAVQGLFAAQTFVVMGSQVVKFVPTGYGALHVTAFDDVRLAGTFSFNAVAGDKALVVNGTFDFRRPTSTAPPLRK